MGERHATSKNGGGDPVFRGRGEALASCRELGLLHIVTQHRRGDGVTWSKL